MGAGVASRRTQSSPRLISSPAGNEPDPSCSPITAWYDDARGKQANCRTPAVNGVIAGRESPPGALESAVGAAGAVEPVQRGQVVVGELEVEDLGVLFDAFAVGGFR